MDHTEGENGNTGVVSGLKLGKSHNLRDSIMTLTLTVALIPGYRYTNRRIAMAATIAGTWDQQNERPCRLKLVEEIWQSLATD